MENLLDLDLKEIVQHCKTDPTICKDDVFWKKKFIQDYGKIPADLPWRFLYEIYYLNQKPKTSSTVPIKKDQEYDAIKSIKSPDQGLLRAVQANKIDLINYFIGKGADWNLGLREAARIGDKVLVDFFIEKGANEWDWAIVAATEGGNKDLIEHFIEKSTKEGERYKPNWDWGLYAATLASSKEVTDAARPSLAREKAIGLIDFFIKKGATGFNWALRIAAKQGDKELVDFFIEKGADNWDLALRGAVEGNNKELADFFIEKGATNLDLALRIATEQSNKDPEAYRDLIELLINKGAHPE